ncbi:hypothetical protein RA263_14600 [Pseudomonas syringae pv. tagetis]|uniref:DUF3467 domain-containing protein n=1 Tax=Pseudomonas syringae pv. tagetis TaxID=129140 RepID=A0A0Q0EBU5_9PSED|nr:hypothetical protein [Pseudomonas syringae group genomosp. 7]KPY83709.1 Uncharacterized protein ALO44_00155 [Pseudomonas syringae pv. tagetis]RMW08814.1 hypothetical protein ALO98_200163 [Pseudomonas syringae pv. tagetis]RMW25819.1 hypothetical protein ALO97_00131 [Pseudomonas syringae pv. tagetis]UNB70269.1 hypothetical protein MME58_08625 [Pseudomonas syringae pv. tagetis]
MDDQQDQTMRHVKAGSYMDEQVDQFDAFAIMWNNADAIHLTFGRTSINVKTSIYRADPGTATTTRDAGEIDVFRLDVGAVTMPIETAKELVQTLSKMILQAEARRENDE